MFIGKAFQIVRKYLISEFSPLRLPNLESWLGNFATSFNKKNAAYNGTTGSNYLSANIGFLGTDERCFSFWYKSDNGTSGYPFLGGATYSCIISSTFVQFRIFDTSVSNQLIVTAIHSVTVTDWNFYTVYYNGSTDETVFYVNGNEIEITSTIDTRTLGNINSSVLWVGYPNNTIIDNFLLHNRKLTLAEHQYLYNSSTGIDYENINAAMKLNLTAWWDMNEISGTRYDLHSTNDLTENGTVVVAEGKVQGVVNNGDYIYKWVDESSNNLDLIQATGTQQPIYTSGYANFVDGTDNLDATISAISGDFTLAFWFKAASSVSNMYPFVIGTDDTTANVSFDFNDANALKLLWNGSNAITTGTAGDYTDGTFRHFMVIRNGSTIELFINNVSVGSSTTNTSFTLGTNWTLGAKLDNTTGVLNGNIYLPIITQSAVSEDERLNIYSYNQPI